MADQLPLLEVSQLTVEFPSGRGRFLAVNNISFNILPGEAVAIVGESGSGKSVTALSIMGLLEQHSGASVSGEITYRDDKATHKLSDLRETEFQNLRGDGLAMIFQEPLESLNPVMTVGKQIMESIAVNTTESSTKIKSRTLELLQDVGIDDPETVFRKQPSKLSGGQRQRILIAIAIASKPRLLIADEPTSSLDAVVRYKVLDKMKSIKKKYGLSMLFITHDLDLAAQIADRMLVMYAGKLVERGKTDTVFSNPQHPYTKGLIKCRPPKGERFYFLPTIDDFMRLSSDGMSGEESAGVEQLDSRLRIRPGDRVARHKQIYEQDPILEVRNIKKWFSRSYNGIGSTQRIHAVKDVSFDLFQGETLGLVGASGSGKTTLARCLTGLHRRFSGELNFLSDQGLFKKGGSKLEWGKHIQYIFQDTSASLNPRLTIGQSLMEPLLIHRSELRNYERRAMIIELLNQVGLKPYHLDRFPKEFSGGQRQRICIARALLLGPRILVCDEAVSSLDVSVQAQVLNLLNELKYQYNLSYIFISHDMNVVRFMSDRIMVMNEGEVVELEEADHLFSNAKSSFTRSLIG